MFSTPQQQDIDMLMGILHAFGEASGLCANMHKSSIMPICCTNEYKMRVQDTMECGIADFPCKYLGLPLSLYRLTKTDLQPLMGLDVPKWFIKVVYKFRRSFLWTGRRDLQGGHCPVNWNRVTRPLRLGGLGIHNLEILGWARWMRWLWM